jgi:multimeric flavodoxin WrbA
MSGEKVVVLDGCGPLDDNLAPVLGELLETVKKDSSPVQTFHLHELKLAHCLGCFNCWQTTPGLCVENDEGRQIARALIQSSTAILFTPVTFGGYSPDLKKMVDHFVQLISPLFAMDHGELHHPPRYQRRPRLIMVGVQQKENPHEAHIFKVLAGRNAINFRPPSFAAEVVVATDDAEALRNRFEDLLRRSDMLPYGKSAAALMPPVVTGVAAEPGPKRALLIVGSPKTKSHSTSGVLGNYLLERLGDCGWETETLTLRASLNQPQGEAELLASVNSAGLILLASPLYSDSLPYLVTKALAVIAKSRRAASERCPKRLVPIINSGFPETFQNSVALAICEEFAAQSGMAWSGGLALGGGGMIGGQPLAAAKRSGLPVQHVIEALDVTAAALSRGLPVPAKAVKLITKNPVRFVPFALWRWIYSRYAGKGFEQEAAKNGIPREKLLDQPYAV